MQMYAPHLHKWLESWGHDALPTERDSAVDLTAVD